MYNNIIFETCSNNYNDVFDYKILNYSNNYLDLLISRIDKKECWWLDLYVNIKIKYNENENTEYCKRFHIGRSASCYKIVSLYLENVPNIRNDFIIDNIPEININKKGKIYNHNDYIEFNFQKEDIIILITNIIFVSSHNNIISHNKRFLQTIETLKSIHSYIKYNNISIVLLEQSKPPIEYLKDYTNMMLEFSKYCDYIIEYKNDPNNDYYSNKQTDNKSLGEMYVSADFFKRIINIEFKSIFKIVGRYILTSLFDTSSFLNNSPTFKIIKGDGRLNIIVFSNFYSIPKKYLSFYIEHQKLWMDRKEPIEHILTMFVESLPDFTLIDKIYMYGKNAATDVIVYL
jgi:hypothetical protein